MKKDRNCPMYPTYQIPYMPGMMQGPGPGMMMNMQPGGPMTNQGMMQQPTMNQTTTTDLNNLNNRLNSLEKRINNLETLVGNNNTTYNTSSFQMM